ncbi:MAG TPA: GspH/FimT family pseudopilin [Vicinamibacterales bacterium]|jgi:prepilin-type N-terminal cleavage/methylation domain-containing protein
MRSAGRAGYTLVELLCATSLLLGLMAAAVPQATANLDEARAAAAARHVAARLRWARLEATSDGASVGFSFEVVNGHYRFRAYVDRNGNGVRAREIDSGVDQPVAPADELAALYSDTDFGLDASVPPVGASAPDGVSDPIRLGRTEILSLSPTGSATSGTLYVRTGRAQWAVRVLGATGRARVLQYDRRTGAWRER